VPEDVAADAVAQIGNSVHELVPSLNLRRRALTIAVRLRHSAYDCFYLALAEERDIPLITADARLIRRCQGTNFERLVRPL
jgi:predicted nucleic acid-binding protein